MSLSIIFVISGIIFLGIGIGWFMYVQSKITTNLVSKMNTPQPIETPSPPLLNQEELNIVKNQKNKNTYYDEFISDQTKVNDICKEFMNKQMELFVIKQELIKLKKLKGVYDKAVKDRLESYKNKNPIDGWPMQWIEDAGEFPRLAKKYFSYDIKFNAINPESLKVALDEEKNITGDDEISKEMRIKYRTDFRQHAYNIGIINNLLDKFKALISNEEKRMGDQYRKSLEPKK